MTLGICFNPPANTRSGSQQTIADYLVPEIMRQQPDTVLFTASPERFGHVPAAQIVALSGRTVAGRRLQTAWGMARHYWNFPRIVATSGCDLVYYPYTMEILHRRIAARRMITVHDVLPMVYPALFPRTVRLWRGRLLPDLRTADAILSPSSNTREGLIAQGGFERWRMHVVANGYRPLTARDATTPVAGGAPYILYVASSHYPYKNCGMLMRAFDQLRERIPHRLIILAKGHPKFTPRLRAVRDALPSRDRIELIDEVSEDALRALYQDAALFAYPSEFEGFGIPPLEAMATGVPVVASNAASIPEVCGSAARYFSPSDEAGAAAAMLAVLTDPALQATMRADGLRQVQRYHWTRMAAEILSLANQVRGWPRPGGGGDP